MMKQAVQLLRYRQTSNHSARVASTNQIYVICESCLPLHASLPRGSGCMSSCPRRSSSPFRKPHPSVRRRGVHAEFHIDCAAFDNSSRALNTKVFQVIRVCCKRLVKRLVNARAPLRQPCSSLSSEKGEVLLRGVGNLRYLLNLSEKLCFSSAHLCSGSLMV